ncbi:hypothetical protein FAI40_02835 [Acetobacteraceae bacterium]|nr:hypothetical protein FAI40_02835 [Acetobacteraceae bacterium]
MSDIHSIVQEAVGQLGGSKQAIEKHVAFTDALVRAFQKRLVGEKLSEEDFKETAIQVFNKTVLSETTDMAIRKPHQGYANIFAEGFAKLAVRAAEKQDNA